MTFPLDDFDTPDEDEGDSSLPTFAKWEHEFVSAECQHREHMACGQNCPICGTGCLCVCHRWAIPPSPRPAS